MPIVLAHRICKRLAGVRKAGEIGYLRPDGKARVTVRYEVDEHGRAGSRRDRAHPRVDAACRRCRRETIKQDVIEKVLIQSRPADLRRKALYEDRDFVYVNPTGKFVIGGPMGDHGGHRAQDHRRHVWRGRPHGGGAFSGKDSTKVDRSAAYAARYVAKNVVAAGLADRCELNVAYAIGVARPVSIAVRTFGTEHPDVSAARIEELVREHFDLRPAAIQRDLDLRRPIFLKTAAYGHFGRDDHDFTWERIDKAQGLHDAAGLNGPISLPEPVASFESRQLVLSRHRRGLTPVMSEESRYRNKFSQSRSPAAHWTYSRSHGSSSPTPGRRRPVPRHDAQPGSAADPARRRRARDLPPPRRTSVRALRLELPFLLCDDDPLPPSSHDA
jgi:hypothetical protein